MFYKFLNSLGLYTTAQLRPLQRIEQDHTRLVQSLQPLVDFTIETTQPDHEVAMRWTSKHYGCEAYLNVRDFKQVARLAAPDYDFRRKGIPVSSPAYQGWLKRRQEDEKA